MAEASTSAMGNKLDSILPQENGVNGSPDNRHTRSPTAISFVPSATSTLNKGAAWEGMSQIANQTPDIIVPQEHKNRTLVLCFDGTGDQFDSDNSNIVELFSALKKDDPEKQMVYYQAGIGTYTVPQIATPLMAKVSKTLDEAIAWNLDAHIMGGYEFLMTNYKQGDKICIFGFSRGAYTARCLAGMIHKVGLLPACNHQQIPFAYKMYTRTDDIGWKQSNAFKAAFSSHVRIDFLGVWDTVSSVGIIPRHLPFTTSNTCVRVFRHAIALDERRSKFKQNTWNRPNPVESQLSERDQAVTRHGASRPESELFAAFEGLAKKKVKIRELEREYSDIYECPTDVEEVWFAGCHCDVGGGSVSNDTRPNLARIPLRWMIRQTFLTETGIMFSARSLRRMGLNLDPMTYHPILQRPPATQVPDNAVIRAIPRPRKVTDKESGMDATAAEPLLSEEELDLQDALSPMYDQLRLSWAWWILELVPMRHRYQRENTLWTWQLKMNLGEGRHIPRQMRHGVKVHRTVRMRMDAKHEADGTAYFPKANLKLEKVTWVD